MNIVSMESNNESSNVLNQMQILAQSTDPVRVGEKVDERNAAQELGIAEKMSPEQIKNITDFVERNDGLVTEYTLTGIADGHPFKEGDNAEAIRNECRRLIIDVGQRMVLPIEYQADYLLNLQNKDPNEVLALTRALQVLSQLGDDTLLKINRKLSRQVHTETVKSGDYRAGSLSASIDNIPFDITEADVMQKVALRTTELTVATQEDLERTKIQLQREFRNILPRIDFVMQMKNPSNPRETRYFQKQVNTDGTSKTGRYAITPTTYNFTTRHINVINVSDPAITRPSWFDGVRSSISGADKYDTVLATLNRNEDANKQVRSNAAIQYGISVVESQDPRILAFKERVEKALGNGGFRAIVQESFTSRP